MKIALDEKGVAYETKMPAAIGTGQPDREFLKANPRGEVPALIDGDVAIFDSTIILEYIEDKWPTPALLPKDPPARARARTIEEVMDTAFEPINWGMGEIRWFKRAEGARAQDARARAAAQARGLYDWLTRMLGDHEWFGGDDLRLGRSVGRALSQRRARPGHRTARDVRRSAQWLARANERPSVAKSGEGGGGFAARHGQCRRCREGAAVQARIPRSSPGMDDPFGRHSTWCSKA